MTISQKERDRQKREWQALKRYRELLAAYELPSIPNPHIAKKTTSDKINKMPEKA